MKIFCGIVIIIVICGLSIFVAEIFAKNEILTIANTTKDEKVHNSNKNEKNILQKDKKEQREAVNIIFGGDMNFDRYIRQIGEYEGYEYILDGVGNLMRDSDCVIANLEGSVTENSSISLESEIGASDNYVFTFDPEIVPVLHRHNVCLVNIGNNHIGNFGQDGIISTKRFLTSGDVTYIGDTHSDNEKRYFIKEIGGVRFGFVNYNAFVGDALMHAMEDISFVKDQSDFIVVYTHWGEEYQVSARENEKNIAHKFIDQGADLIIGSHPHVVQDIEKYKGKQIYYSLGNFVFDQYFSSETQHGLLVLATFDVEKKTIVFSHRDVTMTKDGKTNLVQ